MLLTCTVEVKEKHLRNRMHAFVSYFSNLQTLKSWQCQRGIWYKGPTSLIVLSFETLFIQIHTWGGWRLQFREQIAARLLTHWPRADQQWENYLGATGQARFVFEHEPSTRKASEARWQTLEAVVANWGTKYFCLPVIIDGENLSRVDGVWCFFSAEGLICSWYLGPLFVLKKWRSIPSQYSMNIFLTPMVPCATSASSAFYPVQ
jgi:hypothetical protein